MSLVVGIRFCSMFSYGVRENGFPRRFALATAALPPSPFRENDGAWVGGCGVFLHCVSSTPLAPLLGELSSDSETEGSPWLRDCQWGKEWAEVRSVFSGLLRDQVRRPLSPVCALGTSPKRGSALRGAGTRSPTMAAPCGARELSPRPCLSLWERWPSAARTERVPWLRDCQWGKEWAGVRSVFSGRLYSILWRPLRRFAPLSRCGSVTARL